MDAIAFDLSAIFVGAANDTPRGLDRVDLGYARKIFGDPETNHVGVLPSIAGMGVVSGREAHALVRLTERRWREIEPSGEDEAFIDWLRRRLDGEAAPPPFRRRGRRSRAKVASRYARMVVQTGGSLARPASQRLPRHSVYLNTGQILLHFPRFFSWLESRPDVCPVFLLHDLIPIRYPEYSLPALRRQHEIALETTARRARALIAGSNAAAEEVRSALRERGRPDMPIHVAPLPVDDAFLDAPKTHGDDFEQPYFVIAGSIDQRKNHLMLLHVWRDLARSRGRSSPKLVVVGARGARSQEILHFMRTCPLLAANVVEMNGLSTPAMRELIRGARALLMPSFIEGFGLPIIEALTVGTPVVASDIPAHRESGGEFAVYLDPIDAAAWRDEIDGRARESLDQRRRRRFALKDFRPRSWTNYFDDVASFISALP